MLEAPHAAVSAYWMAASREKAPMARRGPGVPSDRNRVMAYVPPAKNDSVAVKRQLGTQMERGTCPSWARVPPVVELQEPR